MCTRSQPDHFNTSSVLQELDIHTGPFSPASETADHTGGSRDHGWPHNHFIGLKGCDQDTQQMVEQVTVVSLCVPNNRESHQQDRVLKGSLLRLSAAYMWPRTHSSKCRPLQLGLTWQGNHPCLTSEYLLGQPLESISSRPVAQDTITDPLEVTRFSS